MATSAFRNNIGLYHSIQISHKSLYIKHKVQQLSRFFQPALRAPFQFTAVPTPTEATLTQNHRSPDSGLFYASSQVTRLKLSTPPYPRENNNKLKTMFPLSVFGERIEVANHKGGTGQFWRGNGAILGSTWHEIEQTNEEILSLWPECSGARERPVVMPQWGTPANLNRLLSLWSCNSHLSPTLQKLPLLPFTLQPVPRCLPRETLFGRANCQITKSSLRLVQFFFLPLSLTSALKDFKLEGSLSSSHGRKLNTTGAWDSVSPTETVLGRLPV